MKHTLLIALICATGAVTGADVTDLARQIADVMSQSPSAESGQRFVHPKGIVCEGMFVASREAASVSRAAHFQQGTVPVTVRFSDGVPDMDVPDNSPNVGPQGMAIRFMTGSGTDIVAMSHNGFVVGTGEEFLALQEAVFAIDRSKPHPWPVEEFLGGHPRALKYVQDNQAVPAGFDQEAFFANNALRFINSNGNVQTGRYQIRASRWDALPGRGNRKIQVSRLPPRRSEVPLGGRAGPLPRASATREAHRPYRRLITGLARLISDNRKILLATIIIPYLKSS